jgi:hypothetical protein
VPDGVILEPLRKNVVVGEVIVADHQGFAAGTLFAMKLQEMGGKVMHAIAKEALMKMLQDSTMMGRKINAVFVLDGMITAQEAQQLTGMFKVPFVQFGMLQQPREMFGEAYLMTPQVLIQPASQVPSVCRRPWEWRSREHRTQSVCVWVRVRERCAPGRADGGER